MSTNHFQSLEKFESELWKIVDDLRANSGLASNKYFMPIMGLIFLRHATNRFVQIHALPNGNGRHARIMADTMLARVYTSRPIDWAGGHDLQKMGECRVAYIAALKAGDGGDFGPFFKFAGAENHSQSTRGA